MLRDTMLKAAELRAYCVRRFEIQVSKEHAQKLRDRYSGQLFVRNARTQLFEHYYDDDESILIWLKMQLEELGYLKVECRPPGDIARFLAYMDGEYIFEGYPKEYADREREKIEVFQHYTLNPTPASAAALKRVYNQPYPFHDDKPYHGHLDHKANPPLDRTA